MPSGNLKELNKLIRTISKINQQLVTCHDEKKLFRLTCQYLAKVKSYKLICLGLKETDSDEITPLCISGTEEDFIKSIKNVWTKYGLSENSASIALKNGLPFVIKDFKKEESPIPWDKDAQKKGFLSAIVLPLKHYNEFIGTLHIYSDIKNYFIKEEVKFLNKVVKDINIGVCNIRNEKKLADSKKEYKELFNRISSAVVIYEVKDRGQDFIIKDFNKAAEKVEKIKKADIIGKNVLGVFPKMKDFGLFDVFKRVYETGKSENYPLSFYEDKRISGWRENFIYRLPNGDIAAIYNDLTKNKQAEEKIESLAEFPKENPNPVIRTDYDGKILYCNHVSCKNFRENNCKKCEYLTPDLRDALKKIAAKNTFKTVHIEIKRNDKFFLFALIAIKGKNYINCYGVDITKLKNTEVNLKESNIMLRRTLDDIILTLASVVEIKDPFTSGHQKRVTKLSAAIGKEMKLSTDEIMALQTASLLHDIGKVNIPASILTKPGKITKLEFDLIKEHPKTGYEILKGINFPWPVKEIVLQHHERLDGSGYPKGLKEESILLNAKILAVSDVVEAMSSHRPYRPALGIEKALKEIGKYKGRLYDKKVVETCINLFKKKNFLF